MKVTVSAFVALTCLFGVLAAPADDLLLERVEALMVQVKMQASENPIAKMLAHSVSKECTIEKYQTLKLEKFLTEAKIEEDGHIEFNNEEAAVYAFVVLTCTNRSDAIFEFVFDTLYSATKVLHAFKDDHEVLKKAFANMPCAINYAVEKKLIDPAKYTHLDYSLGNFTELECQLEVLDEIRVLSALIPPMEQLIATSRSKCLDAKTEEIVISTAFKYGVLLLNGIPDELLTTERANFVSYVHTNVDYLFQCFAEADEEEVADNQI